MKKVILALCLIFGANQMINSQIQFGVKAGINYNNNGDLKLSETLGNAVKGADAKSGFHAGFWLRKDLPNNGLYIQPELVYTQAKSEYALSTEKNDYDLQKIDIPVLLGKKIFGIGRAFIGPSFQYVIDAKFDAKNITADEFDKFSLGLQMGFGVQFGKLGVDARWERGLTDSEAKFVGKNVTEKAIIDNRTNQIILGVSYRF
ncbi:conserved hypothetical protein [Tenacibaculum maritimum]|uniref:porin family protein n=1 Tax=Tenacibaculum maritimum TaxID=107401 RepID=UPI0012E4D7CC|nr:porin family protein [Tenacibaculum maritimum]CAA0199169.1 conserved hypothetical protein [Tenacibaculum maritimum]CAA0206591.1 conserved hypothetical protein [Tenacibaculum maritimum]